MCVFMLSLLLSLCSQCSHLNSLLFSWTDSVCLCSLCLWARILPHFPHSTFLLAAYAAFSSSDILQSFSCSKILWELLSCPQVVQVTNFFSPCLFFMWWDKCDTKWKQTWHWVFCFEFVKVFLLETLPIAFLSWIFMWAFKMYLFPYVFEHISQSADFDSNFLATVDFTDALECKPTLLVGPESSAEFDPVSMPISCNVIREGFKKPQ